MLGFITTPPALSLRFVRASRLLGAVAGCTFHPRFHPPEVSVGETTRVSPPNDKTKAIVLFSGGLDSALAIRLLLEQGIEVVALNFTSPFCTCNPKSKAGQGCHVAAESARQLGVELRMLPKGMDYLKVIEHPRFGRGRGLNPCIDCRIFVLRKARQMMDDLGASFVVTGEVLGQRPMSQHRRALDLIERESGLEGRLLRPLSAHCLEPTEPEREGVVDRARLCAIEGRSRRQQLDLAKRKGVELFSCAAGGCLLTEPAIARRLADMFRTLPDYELADVNLIKVGRHFRMREDLKVIIGRNHSENLRLAAASERYRQYELIGPPGPLLLSLGRVSDEDRQRFGQLLRYHAPKAGDGELTVCEKGPEGERSFTVTGALGPDEPERWRM